MTKSSVRFFSALLAVAAGMTGVDGFAAKFSATTTTRQDLCRHPANPRYASRDSHDERSDGFINTTRRKVLHITPSAVLLGALCLGWLEALLSPAEAVLVTHPSKPPRALCADCIPSFVAGVVTLPPGFDFGQAQANTALVDPTGTTMTPIPALYVTVRPDRPDHVPQAILQGTRGKSPPVLSARFERPAFPFAFYLTPDDYTPEGMPDVGTDEPWWAKDDLVVSARLDMDGIAATRSPEDLVGRALYQRKTGGEAVEVALMGRGAFGKFATSQKKPTTTS